MINEVDMEHLEIAKESIFLTIMTNIEELLSFQNQFLKFTMDLVDCGNIYITDCEDNIPVEIKNQNRDIKIITCNNSDILNLSDSCIPQNLLPDYLSVLEYFLTDALVITMADWPWLLEATKGTLDCFEVFRVDDDDQYLRELNSHLKKYEDLKSVIVFYMGSDMNIFQNTCGAIIDLIGDDNITAFIPRKIYSKYTESFKVLVFT